MSAQAPSRLEIDSLLAAADDELVIGWRDSEWTGIAPFLEEDVALSSIAQTEIGHARALYELGAADLGTTADELAFDREPEEYRCAPLCELALVPDWAATVARRYLYETADAIRVEALLASASPQVAGLAAKIEREEAYHLLHAEMWVDRLAGSEEGRRRLAAAVERLWPYALAVLDGEERDRFRERVAAKLEGLVACPSVDPFHRGRHTDDFRPLWEEMTIVRRSVAGAAW